MKITDAFLGEHGVFYAQFSHLEQAVPKAETLRQVQDQGALLAAALETHACMEDRLLFVHLEPHLGAQAGPVAMMRLEHNDIERSLAQLPELKDLAGAQRLLLYAVGVAREHFAKEEQILYPLSEQVLGAEVLSRLGAQWAQKRGVAVRG
jgi:hemerythrin-like domain-containing protein